MFQTLSSLYIHTRVWLVAQLRGPRIRRAMCTRRGVTIPAPQLLGSSCHVHNLAHTTCTQSSTRGGSMLATICSVLWFGTVSCNIQPSTQAPRTSVDSSPLHGLAPQHRHNTIFPPFRGWMLCNRHRDQVKRVSDKEKNLDPSRTVHIRQRRFD